MRRVREVRLWMKAARRGERGTDFNSPCAAKESDNQLNGSELERDSIGTGLTIQLYAGPGMRYFEHCY